MMGPLDILRHALSRPQQNTYEVFDISGEKRAVITATDRDSAMRQGAKQLRARESQLRLRERR